MIRAYHIWHVRTTRSPNSQTHVGCSFQLWPRSEIALGWTVKNHPEVTSMAAMSLKLPGLRSSANEVIVTREK